MEKTFLLCDCLGSQDIDAPALSKATGLPCSKVYTCLCTDQIGIAEEAMAAGDTVIACQQERPRFEELAAEIEADVPEFVDIRDRAGWHDDKGDATPKMAALLAEQQLAAPAPRVLDVVSEGTCLIMAPPALALEVAETVADTLAVTVLWQGDYDTAVDPRFDVVKGDLRKASGALGNFNLTFDQLQMLIPGGRGAPSFTAPRDGAKSQCDIILDLTGNTSLFPAPHKRDGYLRADPGSKPAVAEAVREAMQMVGTFEKPLYVRLTKSLCAHSRAEQPACSNCLDLCPTGAIASAGEHVAIDPMICAGCGSCSTLASTYRKAGGNAPRLLVHDEDHGAEMIRLYARFGAGLPVDVIPLAVDALAGFGHAEMLAALGCGFAHVDVLLSPRTERDVIEVQAELARAISGTDTIRLIDVADPDALETALVTETLQPAHDTLLPLGTRRQVARLAGKTLQPEAKVIDLPDAAPYGAVLVDTDACTLCLSCVSLCPSGALGDNPDLPQLRFQEDACLQCGLCANICPEDAITLKPQLNLTAQAFTQVVLHEEEPFACIECGSLFGVKSTVEKITEKLAGKHAMFASSEAAKMIQMCDNCRINAQYHAQNNPLAGKERPRVRTSEDYFSKRKDH